MYCKNCSIIEAESAPQVPHPDHHDGDDGLGRLSCFDNVRRRRRGEKERRCMVSTGPIRRGICRRGTKRKSSAVCLPWLLDSLVSRNLQLSSATNSSSDLIHNGIICRGIRSPGVRQCWGFCTSDFWSSLAFESTEQKPKHCLTPGFLIPLVICKQGYQFSNIQPFVDNYFKVSPASAVGILDINNNRHGFVQYHVGKILSLTCMF